MDQQETLQKEGILERIEGQTSGILLGIGTLLVIISVITRYFFGYSWGANEEVVRFILIWSIYIGASLAVSRGEHVQIELIDVIVPRKIKKYVQFIGFVVGMLGCLILASESIKLNINSIMVNEVSQSYLRLPMSIPKIAVAVGSILMSIKFGVLGYKFFKNDVLRKGGESS